ncbi:MAG: hypothetical protein ACRDH8_01780 [Actinomycetota bacterium]|jgi:hypothetical protein
MDYQWWVFIHIAGALAFLAAHGVSVGVAFRVRKERDPGRLLALLDLSNSSATLMYVSLLVLLAGGVVAGFMGNWWSSGWIWTALAVLIVTMGLMYGIATTYYRRLRTIVTAMAEGSQAVSEGRLAEVLAGPRPWILAVIGFGALLFILYLMMFKPF